jgi:hypothetical protein
MEHTLKPVKGVYRNTKTSEHVEVHGVALHAGRAELFVMYTLLENFCLMCVPLSKWTHYERIS